MTSQAVNSSNTTSLVPRLGMVLVCAWLAWPVTFHWFNSPYDALGPVAFVIWLLSGWSRFELGMAHEVAFTLKAVALGLGGLLTDLNVLFQAALAGVLAGFLRGTLFALIWLFCALSWMPAFGYGLSKLGLGVEMVNGVRIVVALLPWLMGWLMDRALGEKQE